MSSPPAEDLQGRPAKRRGWLFWGCLTVLLFGLAFVALLGYVAYQAYHFTSAEPVALPVYEPEPGEVEAIQKRVEEFVEAVEEGAAPRIEIGADDLNALIAGSREGDRYAGKVYLRVEGESILADVSLPLDLEELRPLGLDVLSDRYLNGTVELGVELRDGKPVVRVKAITANDRAVPEAYVAHVRDRNLLEDLPLDKLGEALQDAKSISVRDGKIIVEHWTPEDPRPGG